VWQVRIRVACVVRMGKGGFTETASCRNSSKALLPDQTNAC
jgi:hypothetical protein